MLYRFASTSILIVDDQCFPGTGDRSVEHFQLRTELSVVIDIFLDRFDIADNLFHINFAIFVLIDNTLHINLFFNFFSFFSHLIFLFRLGLMFGDIFVVLLSIDFILDHSKVFNQVPFVAAVWLCEEIE